MKLLFLAVKELAARKFGCKKQKPPPTRLGILGSDAASKADAS